MDESNSADQLLKVTFRCGDCAHTFKAEPSRIADSPECDWHPWDYFSPCPFCEREATQAHWEKNLLKAHSHATGPTTPEGKAASAANLQGYPTPEQTQRTRFNAMKHGLTARTANYFPARPGKYPECEHCEHAPAEDCLPYNACLKKVSLFMRHQAAFDSGDPSLLMRMRADTQAGIQGLIDQMILAIAQDGGPRISNPEWYFDKDGDLHWVKYTDGETGEKREIMKLEAHPLLKPLMDFISKNGMTLTDMEMTPKVRDDQALLKGYLEEKAESQSANDFRLRLEGQQSKLLEMIERSQSAPGEKVIQGESEVVSNG